MTYPIEPLLGVTAAVSAGLVALLVTVKLVHREILRWRGVRSAHYLAAIGEMVSNRAVPNNPPASWGRDPVFHDALADYRLLVTGQERTFIDDLASRLGVHQTLVARVRRRFPVSTRLRAVARLVDLATPLQRSVLRALIEDRNPHVRTHVVRGLARLGDVESVPRILEMARTARPWEAGRIADSLVAMGAAGVPALRRWVEAESAGAEPHVELVALVARVLGLVGEPEAEATLIDLLRSPREEWRLAAASALEHCGGPASARHLLEALEDRSWRVRARVAVALGAMADPSLARPISGLLYDENWWVRQNAASALSVTPGGTDYLLAALDGPDPYAADSALNQLTVSGVLAEAIERAGSGAATERDRRLAAAARAS